MIGHDNAQVDLAGSLAAISPLLGGALEDAVAAVRTASGRSPGDLSARGVAPEPLSPPDASHEAALKDWVAVTASRFDSVIAPSAQLWPDATRSAWALLLRTLAAIADVEVNVRGVPAASWRRQVSRRFGLAALADWAARLTQTPGLGAAIYRAGATAEAVGAEELALLRGMPADPLSTDHRTDVPASGSQTAAPPVWAGIGGALFRCGIREADGTETDRRLTADVQVRLDRAARGAHMSRFQEILAGLDGRCVDSIGAAAVLIAERAFAAHPAEAARCSVTGVRTTSRVAPRSLRRSAVHFMESAAACVDAAAPVAASVGATVDIATACPGTLSYSHLVALRAEGAATGRLSPTFTHMQPGTLAVEASGDLDRLPATDVLLDAIEDCAHVRHSVLKRPDEHDFVERAHRRPQFAEDLCRSVAAAVASRIAGDIRLTATVKLEESIHPHAAIATVVGRARQFWCTR